MAVLDTKLHIKMDNATQECSIYTVESDGTPTGGIAWPVKVNGANGFIGLFPGDKAGPYPTLLPYKRDGVLYTVQSQVVNNLMVTIVQTAHQTITVTCCGVEYTESFIAPRGSDYTASITAAEGYTAGTLSSKTGVINSSVTITATSAVVIMCTITIKQPANGNIEALYNGVTYSSSFTVPYGSSVTFTCTPNSGYQFTSFTVT